MSAAKAVARTTGLCWGGGEWVWTDGSTRLEERYTASTGRLAFQTDASGNLIEYKHEGPGNRLSEVIDAGSGQRLLLTYATVAGTAHVRLSKVETRSLTVDASDRATSTLGAALKQVEYGYDSQGRLTSVKTDLTPTNTSDNRFYVTGYTYHGTSTRIASILQGDGTTGGVAYASFTYQQVGSTNVYQVASVTDSSGTQTFDYSTAGQTRITDAAGREWRYVYDGQQRLTEVHAPPAVAGGAAAKTIFVYDTSGNVTQVTDALGRVTAYEYDAQGNRHLERDALGNTVMRTFTAQNQVATQTRYRTPDPDGNGTLLPSDPETVRYVYDGKARLRFVVSAEGRVSENRYVDTGAGTSYGQLERTLQYTGGRYDLTPLGLTDPLSEGQLTSWLTGLSAQNKARVQLTQYTYDFRGNLSKRIDYATATTQSEGVLDAGATVTVPCAMIVAAWLPTSMPVKSPLVARPTPGRSMSGQRRASGSVWSGTGRHRKDWLLPKRFGVSFAA
jgi:YD repeat-containing protein